MLHSQALALALSLCAGPAPAPVTPLPALADIKLATLVPEGSLWDKSLRRMAEAAREDTDGRVRLRIYPGGVAGDEPDILRKVRIGQLQAAMLTMSALGDIDPGLNVFLVPLFFRSDEEARYVLEQMDGLFRERLEERGYVVVNWIHAGWLNFFSTERVQTVDDLKRLKHFVWAGHTDIAQWYDEFGFQPVPLASTDLLTGLKTGMVEAMPTTPLAALSFQWFRSAGYMLDYPVAPLYGAIVMSARAWKKLSTEDRAALLAAGRVSQDYLMREVPEQERAAIEAMKKRGLVVSPPLPGPQTAPWLAVSDFFAERIRDALIPAEIADVVNRHLAEFRATADGPPRQAGDDG